MVHYFLQISAYLSCYDALFPNTEQFVDTVGIGVFARIGVSARVGVLARGVRKKSGFQLI